MSGTHDARETCEKCQQWRGLQETSKMYGRVYGETWSGVVNGRHVWYDVSAAREAIRQALEIDRANGGGVIRTQEFSVAELWENQAHSAYIVAEHLAHVDMSEPVILAVTHRKATQEYLSLIDGTHRLARARNEGRLTISAYRLSYVFSDMIRIPTETALIMEIVTEAVSTGASVESTEDGIVIRGGTLRESTPADHPRRAELVELVRSKKTILAPV